MDLGKWRFSLSPFLSNFTYVTISALSHTQLSSFCETFSWKQTCPDVFHTSVTEKAFHQKSDWSSSRDTILQSSVNLHLTQKGGARGEVRRLETYLRVLSCLHFVKPDQISDFLLFCIISIINQTYDSIDW